MIVALNQGTIPTMYIHMYIHRDTQKQDGYFCAYVGLLRYCCDYIQNVIITIANLANIVMIAITITN